MLIFYSIWDLFKKYKRFDNYFWNDSIGIIVVQQKQNTLLVEINMELEALTYAELWLDGSNFEFVGKLREPGKALEVNQEIYY